jgi:hypothetical protein
VASGPAPRSSAAAQLRRALAEGGAELARRERQAVAAVVVTAVGDA